MHQKLQSKDDNVDPHSGNTSCRISKDPKKKESLHLSEPPLLPPGHVRRQPKKVWQSTQYLVVNNAMMFSPDNIRFTSDNFIIRNCWTEWMLWWRGHRPPWQRREWSSFKQQALKKRSSLKTHPFSIADIPTLMQIATAKCAPLGKRVFWSSHPLNSKHRQLFCRRTSTKVTNEYAMVNSLPTIL